MVQECVQTAVPGHLTLNIINAGQSSRHNIPYGLLSTSGIDESLMVLCTTDLLTSSKDAKDQWLHDILTSFQYNS